MEFTSAQMLKFAEDNGIINLDTIRIEMEMKKRNELLEQHPYKIYKSTDGYWHTYIMQENGKRKAIKKKTKEAVEDAVLGVLTESKNEPYSFKSRFEKWIKFKKICNLVSDNTVLKYQSDYKRFFEGYPFEKLDIREITIEDICEHFQSVLADKEIPYRAFLGIVGYLKGTFEKAANDKVISKTDNPCLYIDIQVFKQLCTDPEIKTSAQRTMSNSERNILREKLHHPKSHNNNPVTDLAIELSLYTGMRVGELAGLLWSRIDFENMTITIDKSERKNRKTKQYIISDTKNHKIRHLPISEEILDVLLRIKQYQTDNDICSEFVFFGKNGKIHASAISDSARNKTMNSEFSGTKSIHTIRRTVNSRMRKEGVSAMTAASLLGHTERVNENNYTYDVSDMKEKLEALKKAGAF